MPCYKPIQAWRTTEKTPNGKNKIAFQKSGNSTTPLTIPCNMCIGCRTDRSQSWAIRCLHEAQLHNQNSFITLTYAPEHHPPDGSLIKFHFQDFIKRLRNHLRRNSKIGKKLLSDSRTARYYMCGEYGERFTRPHYHACLFGIDFRDKEPFKDNEGIITWSSAALDDIWEKGYCTIGDVNFETAAYVSRYIHKKVLGQDREQHYYRTCDHTMSLIPIEPEYSSMSLKPAIGKGWYEKYDYETHRDDYLIHEGRKISIPRYYDKLYEVSGGDIEAIKAMRKQKQRKHLKDNSPERLAAREEVHLLKHQQLTRSYENDDTQDIHYIR